MHEKSKFAAYWNNYDIIKTTSIWLLKPNKLFQMSLNNSWYIFNIWQIILFVTPNQSKCSETTAQMITKRTDIFLKTTPWLMGQVYVQSVFIECLISSLIPVFLLSHFQQCFSVSAVFPWHMFITAHSLCPAILFVFCRLSTSGRIFLRAILFFVGHFDSCCSMFCFTSSCLSVDVMPGGKVMILTGHGKFRFSMCFLTLYQGMKTETYITDEGPTVGVHNPRMQTEKTANHTHRAYVCVYVCVCLCACVVCDQC